MLAVLLCCFYTELKPKLHAPAAYLLGGMGGMAAHQHKQAVFPQGQWAARGVPHEGDKKEPFPLVMPESSTDLLRTGGLSFTQQIIC